MAVSDVITQINDVTNGTPVDFQPAAGVEVILTDFSITATATVNNFVIDSWDGTIGCILTGNQASANVAGVLKHGFTNTIFIRFRNNVGADTRPFGFSGIQIQ